MKDFFISYNYTDKLWATGLSGWLTDEGYTVVIQANDFAPGSNFVLEMDKAAREAERTIAVLSPGYLASSFTPAEWAAAFANDPTGTHRYLIPVIVRDCDVEGLLKQIVHIKLVDLSMEDAHKRFISGIRFALTDSATEDQAGLPASKSLLNSDRICQTAVGDGNIQAGGDVYINKKEVNRSSVTREPGDVSDTQARAIQELIDKVVEAQVKSGKSTRQKAYGEWHSRLKKRYVVTSYKKIRTKDYEDAVSWLRQQRAITRPKLRRTNNPAWRKEHYAGIYARWKSLGYGKEEIYDFAFTRLALKKTISSLKDLGEQNLKKLYGIIFRMS